MILQKTRGGKRHCLPPRAVCAFFRASGENSPLFHDLCALLSCTGAGKMVSYKQERRAQRFPKYIEKGA